MALFDARGSPACFRLSFGLKLACSFVAPDMSATSNNQPPVTATPDAPKLLEELVRQAESAMASDVHLQMVGKSAEVCFRLDGVMTPATTLPEAVADRVFGRIKFL